MAVKMIVGNETITDSGISKVEILGDGLNGVALLSEKEVQLKVIHGEDVTIIRINRDESVKAYSYTMGYRPFRLKPIVTFNGLPNGESFKDVLFNLRHGKVSVHDQFSEICDNIARTLNEGRDPLWALRNNERVPDKIASLRLHETKFSNLQEALQKAKPTVLINDEETTSFANRALEIEA